MLLGRGEESLDLPLLNFIDYPVDYSLVSRGGECNRPGLSPTLECGELNWLGLLAGDLDLDGDEDSQPVISEGTRTDNVRLTVLIRFD